ncbi:FluG domain-containing protein [Amylocarpus encephaloides]|uniref:FluG domain-containing protein n=1 Tax=Amylocarpus encephaloides TaxID=45428 RepID=A0A9P7YFE5_9HELO|nr:FluG domain-containing protein [Amylocarpus encephaloides]
MGPTTQTPAADTLKTLQNVQKRRSDVNRILKERQKVHSGEDFKLLEDNLNNKRRLPQKDSDNTKASIYYIRQKFIKYCDHRGAGEWRIAILKQNCPKGRIMAFLRWICVTYIAKKQKTGKKKSVNQYWRDFGMLYQRMNNGDLVDKDDASEVVTYINTVLKDDFDLDTTSKPKPVVGPDDLLLLLVHHWARDESVFPTEDDRHDVATIMLFDSYTGGRPAEFVHASRGKANQDPLGEADEDNKCERLQEVLEKDYYDESDAGDGPEYDGGELFDDNDQDLFIDYDSFDEDVNMGGTDSGYCTEETDDPMIEEPNYDDTELDEFGEAKRKYKALCYEDIRIWVVQNPKRGERDLLAMEVSLRHHKGADNKPKPTTFLFRENPLAILCPISHMLVRAIRDDAILVDGYTSAEPFFGTDLPSEGMSAFKVHWKEEWLKRPVFRRSVWTANGWVKSKTEPMPYSTYNFYINRLGRNAGFEDQLTSYCFRRGTANAVNGAASDSVRDQVMRHDPSTGVFGAAYRDHLVRFNVQDAFLESNVSDDGLTRAFTHMSLRCNPGAPKGVPDGTMKQFYAGDPEIVDLEGQCAQLRAKIKWEYRMIKKAPAEKRKEYKDLRGQLLNAKKCLKREMDAAIRKDYFFSIHNDMMKRQLERHRNQLVVDKDPEDPEPKMEHQLPERTRLQEVLCDLSKDLCPQEIFARKVLAINLMVALAGKQEVRTCKPRSPSTPPDPVKIESPSLDSHPVLEPDPFPLVCEKTQCIICIGNQRYSLEQRKCTFKRVSNMWDHTENVHKLSLQERPVCEHPKCSPDSKGLFFDSVNDFKCHVGIVHKINLRP